MVTIDEAMQQNDADLLGYLSCLMDSAERGMDLFDEVYTRFCEAYEAGAVFATPLKARAWLFKVGRNTALKALGRDKREAASGLMDDDGTECRHLAAVESRVDLGRALRRLPAQLREVFLLVVSGMSCSEAGRRLNVSDECARQRYIVARGVVRGAMVEDVPQSRAHDEYTRQGRVSYHPTVTTMWYDTRWGSPSTR